MDTEGCAVPYVQAGLGEVNPFVSATCLVLDTLAGKPATTLSTEFEKEK